MGYKRDWTLSRSQQLQSLVLSSLFLLSCMDTDPHNMGA